MPELRPEFHGLTEEDLDTTFNSGSLQGVEKGIIFSYPVSCRNGEYKIIEGLDVNEFSRKKLKETEIELIEEREAVENI